jgi:hypothetical protein
MKKSPGGTRDKLLWKWLRGGPIAPLDFGTPVASTPYALCIYAAAPNPEVQIVVPSSATKWHFLSTGFRYKDPSGAAGGVQKIILKGGGAGRTKVQVLGRGPLLPDPALESIAAPVRVQLVNGDTGTCWESRFEASDIDKQNAGAFKAKSSG